MHAPTHLLEHDAHVDHGEARPSVCFRDQQPRRAQISEAPPDRLTGAGFGLQLVAYVRTNRRLLLQELSSRPAQGLLLNRELEVHLTSRC